MKFIIATVLGGGTLVAANMPNPSIGECAIADFVFTRSEPTMIDPDGEITGARQWQVCGFQIPNGAGGYTAKDDTFYLDLTADEAEMVLAAAGELSED